jgi:hypothetical protein
MKYWNLILGFVIFCSCNKFDYNINQLNNEKVKFKDLPVKIAEYITTPTDYQNDINTMLLVLPKEEVGYYRLETINTWIGPWVSFEKLIDVRKNVSYKIDQGYPGPYIVFRNKLYIPNSYNMFTTVGDLSSLEFTCYDLE